MSKKATKKEDIMSAALALFAERGFDGTTMPMISKSAGVAAGTVYCYFESKEELLNVLFRKSVEELLVLLRQGREEKGEKLPSGNAPGDDRSFRGVFRQIFYGLFYFAKANPLTLPFVTSSANHLYLDGESRRCVDDFMQYVRDTVEWGQREGGLRALPLEAIISIVYGAFLQLSVNFRSGWLKETPELLAELEECCWNAVTSK